ncbi:hypothetical protein P5V15_009660 [Pogonomyrmex californicus]
MYRFNISAPGAIYLHGDPVLGYAKSAVIAGLNLRTKLSFTSLFPRMVPTEYIELDFSTINLYVKIPLNIVLKTFFDKNVVRKTDMDDIHDAIKDFVDSLETCDGTYKPNNLHHRLSLQAFFFLLVAIAYKETINITATFIVKLSSELAIGESLGSSQSFAVCLAACFWRWSNLQKGTVIYEFTLESEQKILFYGGICDNMVYKCQNAFKILVSIRGSIVETKEWLMQKYTDFPNIKILLVFSNVSLNHVHIPPVTGDKGSFMKHYLDIINVISKESIQLFDMIRPKELEQNQESNVEESLSIDLQTHYEKLSDLININQGLLKALDMSDANINIVCAIAQKYSLKAKATGTGRGGYVFILLPPNIKDKIVHQLIHEYVLHDFPAILTNLCGKWNGVRVE